jgi:hypothetical protein
MTSRESPIKLVVNNEKRLAERTGNSASTQPEILAIARILARAALAEQIQQDAEDLRE